MYLPNIIHLHKHTEQNYIHSMNSKSWDSPGRHRDRQKLRQKIPGLIFLFHSNILSSGLMEGTSGVFNGEFFVSMCAGCTKNVMSQVDKDFSEVSNSMCAVCTRNTMSQEDTDSSGKVSSLSMCAVCTKNTMSQVGTDWNSSLMIEELSL